jgi:ribonuclease P protein subunit POP4
VKVTPEVIRQEFIGTEAKVATSTHKDYTKLSGKVVDETRNTLTLLNQGKKRVITKNSVFLHFTIPGGAVVEIDGKLLVGRPEDRLKKSLRRLW